MRKDLDAMEQGEGSARRQENVGRYSDARIDLSFGQRLHHGSGKGRDFPSLCKVLEKSPTLPLCGS